MTYSHDLKVGKLNPLAHYVRIEHCPCISEIKRVLKTNGIFFCSTPSLCTDWLRKIIIILRLLENQDFEGHDYIINLKKVTMNLIKYKKMFFGTSQFGIFVNNKTTVN